MRNRITYSLLIVLLLFVAFPVMAQLNTPTILEPFKTTIRTNPNLVWSGDINATRYRIRYRRYGVEIFNSTIDADSWCTDDNPPICSIPQSELNGDNPIPLDVYHLYNVRAENDTQNSATTSYRTFRRPNQSVLYPDWYQAESLAFPDIITSGTWYISGDSLASNVSGSTVSFLVDFSSDYILLQQSAISGTYNICVTNLSCVAGGSSLTGFYDTDLSEQRNVTLTVTSNDEVAIDYLQIIPAVSTPFPTATPDPYLQSVSGTQGQIHYTITVGDIAIVNSALFLFFSFWAVLLIYWVFNKYVWE